MKKRLLISIALVLITCAVLWRCSDEGQNLSPETTTVTFSLDAAAGINGRVDASVTPTSLYISLIDDAGTPVATYQKIKILALGDTYVSEAVTLAPGYYRITDFLLASDTDSILYATPKKGSALEKAVERPLPYRFRVTKNDVNNISMQVVDVSKTAAKDLGYAAFNIGTVNPLQISVFALTGNEQRLASATGVIMQGSDTVKQFDLAAAVNTISFTGSPALEYTLVIYKPGYNIKHIRFTYDALTDIAMKVHLQDEALMVDLLVADTSLSAGIFLVGTGNAWVNWGDGSGLEPAEFNSFFHKYPAPGRYHMSLVGDLDNASEFFHSGQRPNRIEKMNFSAIKNITRLTMSDTEGPAIIDVRKNTQLTYLALATNPTLERLLLPEDHAINFILLAGATGMNTAAVDETITAHYNAVASTNSSGGLLILDAPQPYGPQMIGPPSWDAFSKLLQLRDQYGWNISPELTPENP